jgi:integrase
MCALQVLDSAGRRRSPATMPGYHSGRPPRNKGMRYPADPPTVEEIIAVMRQAGDGAHALRARGLIAVLWRAGLRIDETPQLAESDLDEARGALIGRHGTGDKRREVGMDQWGWEHVRAWLTRRGELPVGPLFCVVDGPTRGRAWSGTAARAQLRRLARRSPGVDGGDLGYRRPASLIALPQLPRRRLQGCGRRRRARLGGS